MESKPKSEGRRDPCFDCLYSSRSFFSSFGDKYLNCERIGILNGLHPTTCSGQLHFILKKTQTKGKSRTTVVRSENVFHALSTNKAKIHSKLASLHVILLPMSSHGIVKRLVTVVKLNVILGRNGSPSTFLAVWELTLGLSGI